YGGGLSNRSSTTTLTNTIVASQTGGGDIYTAGGTVSGNFNLIGDGSGISGGSKNLPGGPPAGIIDPVLAPLGDDCGAHQTKPPLPGRPAIFLSTLNSSQITDQRGFPRGTYADCGAFQDQGFTVSPVAGSTPQSAAVGTVFAHPLAVTVTANNTPLFTNPV